MPTVPGSYTCTLVLRLGDKTIEIELGILVIPEPTPEPTEPTPEPTEPTPEPTEPTPESAPEPAPALVPLLPVGNAEQTGPLYRVTDRDGRDITHRATQKNGVLTITADYDFAILTGKLQGLEQLRRAEGIKKIVFVTGGAGSAFQLSDLLVKASLQEMYKLTHDGKTVKFVAGKNMTDVKGILE